MDSYCCTTLTVQEIRMAYTWHCLVLLHQVTHSWNFGIHLNPGTTGTLCMPSLNYYSCIADSDMAAGLHTNIRIIFNNSGGASWVSAGTVVGLNEPDPSSCDQP